MRSFLQFVLALNVIQYITVFEFRSINFFHLRLWFHRKKILSKFDTYMAHVGFDDLLQQAEQLSTGLDAAIELPQVQRNFHQILDAGQRLCAKTQQEQDNAQVKASLLLSTHGHDIPKISERLKTLSSTPHTLEPLEAGCDTDIEGFLRNERENAILAIVEEQKQNTFCDVEKRYWQTQMKAWENEKQQILNRLIGSDGALNFSHEINEYRGLGVTQNKEAAGVNPRTSMGPWELAYAREIHEFNDEVIEGKLSPNLAELCRNGAEKMKEVNISALWMMVSYMTETVPLGTANSTTDIRTSKHYLEKLINQARTYLEHSYKEYMQNCVYARPHVAQLGGTPGTLNLVKSFLKVFPVSGVGYEDGDIDGIPLWAVIFYCLRCGDLEAVMEVVKHHEHILHEFSVWVEEYCGKSNRKLSSASENKMKIQYKRTIRTCTDLYKVAVYCVLARCDVSEVHQEVVSKTEDYLWLKLCQVVVSEDSELQADQLTLLRLQKLLSVDYGETHFGASSNPLLYFQILFLTCQFESAIEFLSRFDTLRCHAVHVALSMHTQGLLATSTALHANLLSQETFEENGMAIIRRLNLSRLIMLYTRKFEATDPREALNYFFFLRDVRAEGQSLFAYCVSELVRETGEFEMLLGQLNKDGTRKPGAIDKYCADDSKNLISKVAADTETRGLYEDAVHLHDLTGNHDQAITLLNRLLCCVVSKVDSVHPDRLRLKTLALNIAERYKALSVEMSHKLLSTFHLLLDLMTFFDLYHANKIEQALDIVRELQMLPTSSEQVQAKVDAFKLYADEVRQNVADLLLAVMNLLTRQCNQQQNPNKSIGTKAGDTVVSNARASARALITFAGMLPYHLPGDTTAQMVQLEVQMN